MNLSFDFRQSRTLEGVMAALERLVARINTVWKKEHNPATGERTNVTVTGDLVVRGDVVIDGDLSGPDVGGGGGSDLEYVGDYTPMTYNSGDIVVGADGITYMCVKDGTTTPPEPWPAGATVPLPLHHTTHEPGGTDVIANVPWLNVENTFGPVQNFTNGLKERGRTVPMGVWTDYVPTLTPDVGTVTGGTRHASYMVIGKSLFVIIGCSGLTLTGAMSRIDVSLPYTIGLLAGVQQYGNPVNTHVNGVWGTCLTYVQATGPAFSFYQNPQFVNSADRYFWGQLFFILA